MVNAIADQNPPGNPPGSLPDNPPGNRTANWPANLPPGLPHDVPSAAQLLESVREWIERDVLTQTGGRLQFHARVAINCLAMVVMFIRKTTRVNTHSLMIVGRQSTRDHQQFPPGLAETS